MRWGGVTIAIFLLYQLAHFTWGTPVIASDFIRGDAFHNLVAGFSFPPVALIYRAGVVALCFHLYHGAWSMFQTLGLSNSNTESPLRAFSVVLAAVIVIGFLVVPISILLGIIHE
jgi:succinate dehydrogenase / fumarate reductase cytochrome b subunit